MIHQIETKQKKSLASDKGLRFFVLMILGAAFVSGIFYRFFEINLLHALPAFTVCPFRTLYGLSCPGCGLTRAFLSLGQFKFANVVQFNPLSIPLAIGMIGYLWLGRIPLWLQRKMVLRFMVIILFSVWLLRLIGT